MKISRTTAELAKVTGDDVHTIGKGWVLDGAGPARFGWYRRAVTGRQYFLGRTLAEIKAKLSAGDVSPIR